MLAFGNGLQDALAYLPHKRVIEYRRNQIIYDEAHPSPGLSLVFAGRVKVTTIEAGSEVVIALVGPDNFFGECGLLGAHASDCRQQATALEQTALMSWTTAEIETEIERHPKLGMALIQVAVTRCMNLEERLQSLALDLTAARLAVGLLQLAKGGITESDGAIRIPSLTHQTLAGYIGTSREVVTAVLNQWRHRGLVRYSRKAIQVYPEALSKVLQEDNGGGR
jgi:CRP/FNR family transcriptional regulator, cyclic AMP receptor protein